jgi:hypothetical protein
MLKNMKVKIGSTAMVGGGEPVMRTNPVDRELD